MNKYYTEIEWHDKKVAEGFYGFGAISLDKIFDEPEIQKIYLSIQYYQNQLDKTSQYIKNERTSAPAFVEWFKELIKDRNNFNNIVGKKYDDFIQKDSIRNLDRLYNEDGETVTYDYQFVSDAFYVISQAKISNYDKIKIPCLSDLAIAFSVDNRIKKFNEKVINKVTKKALKYLYNEDIDNYSLFKQHINVIPPYGIMAAHEDVGQDGRDFTIIIYINSEWKEEWRGELRFLIPRFDFEYIPRASDPSQFRMSSKHKKFDIKPIYSNVVIMNHQVNDNIAGIIPHEVKFNDSGKNRYSLYSLYKRN